VYLLTTRQASCMVEMVSVRASSITPFLRTATKGEHTPKWSLRQRWAPGWFGGEGDLTREAHAVDPPLAHLCSCIQNDARSTSPVMFRSDARKVGDGRTPVTDRHEDVGPVLPSLRRERLPERAHAHRKHSVRLVNRCWHTATTTHARHTTILQSVHR
jgi:hypothetical protein